MSHEIRENFRALALNASIFWSQRVSSAGLFTHDEIHISIRWCHQWDWEGCDWYVRSFSRDRYAWLQRSLIWIASSTGLLLKTTGLKVTAIKIDPYMNIDAGTMAPTEHGEKVTGVWYQVINRRSH